jgi:hypothetical protein
MATFALGVATICQLKETLLCPLVVPANAEPATNTFRFPAPRSPQPRCYEFRSVPFHYKRGLS